MTEQEKRLHRACFTGHRPDKLMAESNVFPIPYIANRLHEAISDAVDGGITTFISGMCPGIDILAAEEVINMRQQDNRIKLIAAMPYPRFAFNWDDGWGQRVQNVLKHADYVKYVSSTYTGRGVFQVRNMWMVEHSHRLIAYWNGTSGGTKNTVDYCLKKNENEFINCYT